ncbi:MAG: type II secretion system F family protein [Candidatus Sungbacteria bacterium]|nr:type II secretion system F family protein [Candidatus Sungbacteria bacterium]
MLFRYTAIDRTGAAAAGEREAVDEKSLAKALRSEGFMLTAARPKSSVWQFLPDIRGISLVEKMMFARNLAVMVGAGLSMVRALEASEEETSHLKFKRIIADLRQSITKGMSFSQALSRHREVFGDFFVHMTEAGELSGKLEYSLKLLARQMKRDHDLHSKVASAMVYPGVVFSALILIGVLMLTYVVPTLAHTFRELRVPLPWVTQLILALSESFLRYGFFVGALLIIVLYALYRLFRSRPGEAMFDRLILKVPVFGSLVQRFNAARFSRTMASLIAAGLPITKALEITARVVGNTQFQISLHGFITEIEKGKALSFAMRQQPNLYAPLVTQMIAVGEETGTLGRMLLRVALFYEEEVATATKNISSTIEPVMMIFIGAAVGLFAVSMIQPLYSSIGKGF